MKLSTRYVQRDMKKCVKNQCLQGHTTTWNFVIQGSFLPFSFVLASTFEYHVNHHFYKDYDEPYFILVNQSQRYKTSCFWKRFKTVATKPHKCNDSMHYISSKFMDIKIAKTLQLFGCYTPRPLWSYSAIKQVAPLPFPLSYYVSGLESLHRKRS